MTDSEKFDLILSEIQGMKSEIQGIKSEVQGMKSEIQGIKSEVQDLKSEMQDLKSEVQDLKSEMQDLKSEVQDLKQRTVNIETDIKDIKVTLETEIRVNIRRVAEGHLDLSRNLHEALKIDNEKEMLAIRVNVLETEIRRIKEKLDIA